MKKPSVTVCKFGGTSLADVDNIKRVIEIIKSDPARRIIVVSAPGKRSAADTKITDTLFDIFYKKQRGESFDESFSVFSKRFHDIEAAFGLKTNLDEIMEEFYREVTGEKSGVDFVTSTGEYFMAKVMAALLGYTFVDLDKVPVIAFANTKAESNTGLDAGSREVDLQKSRAAFRRFRGQSIVIPGFYGTLPDGSVKIFPRGGSDITGAIIANIADADLYENWTDVDGIYDRDPNKHADAKHFDTISYDEVEALARAGANVLHPDCIRFVRDKGIPIHIRNTFAPGRKGTIIR
jgi:aspartate kinase